MQGVRAAPFYRIFAARMVNSFFSFLALSRLLHLSLVLFSSKTDGVLKYLDCSVFFLFVQAVSRRRVFVTLMNAARREQGHAKVTMLLHPAK